MSGASMNYLYSKLLHDSDFEQNTPERKAFAKHIALVAQALHDIERVDSGDYGPGDEVAAINACLGRPVAYKYIYEYGTTAEGIRGRIRSLSRAIKRKVRGEE